MIVDLRGCDYKFLEACERIFETSTWLDSDGSLLLDWTETAVSEIVGFYCVNPMTAIAGSLKEGPYFENYTGLDMRSADQIQQFSKAYTTLANELCLEMHHCLEPFVNEALEKDFTDIQCKVVSYRLDTLIISIDGVSEEDDPYYSPEKRY